METIKLIYIGNSYYTPSKSVMSSIYTEAGQRYDWGFVQRDLDIGKSIEIRQANSIERQHYEQKLYELKKQQQLGEGESRDR